MIVRTSPTRLPAAWHDFAIFLRAPQLIEPRGLRSAGAGRTIGAMLALHMLGLIVLLLLLSGWQALTGIDGPQAFAEIPAHYLIPLAVLAAPLAEETVFRGWLRGRPRTLWLLACLIVAIAAVMTIADTPLQQVGALLAALMLASAGWLMLRRRPTAGWFTRHFAAVFFTSAAVFGVIHVFNYSQPGLAHLPMVLPQVWAGLTLGFLRMRIGLPAAMLVHGTSNGLALALASMAG